MASSVGRGDSAVTDRGVVVAESNTSTELRGDSALDIGVNATSLGVELVEPTERGDSATG